MEKLILLWLPLQGDVQCRHISPESYIVIICKLISTCDLMRRGVAWGGQEEPVWNTLFRAALGEVTISLYCMASQLQMETQSGHLLPSSTCIQTKNNNPADVSRSGGFAPRSVTSLCQYTVNNNKPQQQQQQTTQPDWLRTTLTEVADVVKYVWGEKKKQFFFFFSQGVDSG